ncbi:MAG TPA: PD-(D/E)XK nuclease family protein [Candidatus Paceibacterota bacterium]
MNNRFASRVFDPLSKEPFRISRSKIELFKDCERCLYLNLRYGVNRPSTFPFTLNNAVDALLKKEFDIHRAKGKAHPLMERYGIDAVPFDHPKMEEWRDALRRGIRHHHLQTNFIVSGGIDDLWINPADELIIVDYKATAKTSEVNIDADWQMSYKRQMEIYQWLFRQNEFKVSNIGYFVYANGQKDKDAFDGVLEFDVQIIGYEGNDSWIPGVLGDIRSMLENDKLPEASKDCEHCSYRERAREVEK